VTALNQTPDSNADAEHQLKKWGYLLTKAPFIHEHAYMQVL